ncbi:hypothetical protein [Caulobacter endophyticus]|uniref:Phage tail protein (Tail_P2_I) n=1 Tax=Caulobacter endophyticus TaxID=2172652 RepID=A0A2T9JEP3_9CAUL|nr:hypothetical protein [Caulobacter endophyticus]PVM82172.1 hypothetical protein DDF67_24525 [Caulobacter endophyticus]
MSFDARTLYELLPAFTRTRDHESGGALLALIEVIAEQVAILEEDLDQLYDDQFIETCAEWVAPYIGDLVGYKPLHGVTAKISSPRAEVADTIRLRRGKGTAATLEALARDVTGWGACVVEHYGALATTQYMNHLRPASAAFVDLRRQEPFERLGGAFDPFTHTPELRSPGLRRNVSTVGIHLWRLQSQPVSSATAARVDDTRFLFNPQGAPQALFTQPVPTVGGARVTARNVSQPLTRRAFAAAKADHYGAGRSLFIDGVRIDAVNVCDLSDAKGGDWAHKVAPGKVAIDPQLGRIVFGTAPPAPPRVSYYYGLSDALGGGGYDRERSFVSDQPPIRVPGAHAKVQAALDAAAGGGAVEIADSGRYAETLAIKATAPGAHVELRAADQRTPFLALGGKLVVTGADLTSASLNGLWIAGAPVHVPAADNRLQHLSLRHCTLTPGVSRTAAGLPARPGEPMLIVEAGVSVEIDHCILGGILAAPGARVTIRNSIIDAGAPDATAYAGLDGASGGGELTLSNCTVIGKVHARQIDEVENCLFAARLAAGDSWLAPVWIDRRDVGCTRFCYLPPGSRTPRPYRCLPGAADDPVRVQPVFTSARFGDPGYGQLSRRTPVSIRQGAEDGSELGAFHDLHQPQRETNLRVRLDEYLRFGLEAVLVFAT